MTQREKNEFLIREMPLIRPSLFIYAESRFRPDRGQIIGICFPIP